MLIKKTCIKTVYILLVDDAVDSGIYKSLLNLDNTTIKSLLTGEYKVETVWKNIWNIIVFPRSTSAITLLYSFPYKSSTLLILVDLIGGPY